jgi:hypothetical protein
MTLKFIAESHRYTDRWLEKRYIHTAQKKVETKKELRKTIKKQLALLGGRNLGHINQLLESYLQIPLKKVEYKYLLVIQSLYDQQMLMFINYTHSIKHSIVSIHQPHV